MTQVSPRAADAIRKVVAYSVTGVGTWFLLRVLFRLATGKGSWLDPELWVFLILGTLMTWWVIVAKPVRRSSMRSGGPGTTAGPSEASSGPNGALSPSDPAREA